MARPSLNQLAPTRTDDTLDRTFAVNYDGNAALKPVKADQADLSLEWYFDKKSVLSGAVFWKKIEDFVTTELQENVDIGCWQHRRRRPCAAAVRRESADQRRQGQGARLRVRRAAFLRNGFGLRANYSYTDTKAYMDGVHVGQLEGVSKSSYSAALLFENDRWDAQLAADYSGEYTEVNDAVGGLSQIAEPITWVTASVAVQDQRESSVSLEGRNLLDEYYLARLGRTDMLAGSRPGDVPICSARRRNS